MKQVTAILNGAIKVPAPAQQLLECATLDSGACRRVPSGMFRQLDADKLSGAIDSMVTSSSLQLSATTFVVTARQVALAVVLSLASIAAGHASTERPLSVLRSGTIEANVDLTYRPPVEILEKFAKIIDAVTVGARRRDEIPPFDKSLSPEQSMIARNLLVAFIFNSSLVEWIASDRFMLYNPWADLVIDVTTDDDGVPTRISIDALIDIIKFLKTTDKAIEAEERAVDGGGLFDPGRYYYKQFKRYVHLTTASPHGARQLHVNGDRERTANSVALGIVDFINGIRNTKDEPCASDGKRIASQVVSDLVNTRKISEAVAKSVRLWRVLPDLGPLPEIGSLRLLFYQDTEVARVHIAVPFSYDGKKCTLVRGALLQMLITN